MAENQKQNYLTHPKGIMSWLLTLDHKRIGLMYLFGGIIFFFLGGVLALGMRLELAAPGNDFMSNETYNNVYTLHGAIMIFLFIIPAIPGALGNMLLPLMLGAKDVAFPRLNLASFYIYTLGALFVVYTIIAGGVDTGWTFYTPYSTTSTSNVIPMTMGIFIIGFSSILTGLNFIATIHKMRIPGLTWYKLPLFVWALYGTSLVQITATPVIAITMVLLILERLLGIGIFDPALGGDPVLYQHFFWFYSHPAVYIMILPAFGIISEIIPVHSRKKIWGYKFIAFSTLSIAFIGFLVWGHHMFTSGQSVFSQIVFSFITYFVGIPTGVKIFSWILTMYKGQVSFTPPMLYALSFLFLFTIGGLTGIFLGAVALDIHLHDTYFVVAHFHYVMQGGTIIAFLGGLHHWWPKTMGAMYNQTVASICCLGVFLGFNGTFFPQFLLGLRGMPRRYATYDPQYAELHNYSSFWSGILGLSIFIAIMNLLWSLRKSNKLDPGTNPWGAMTLEWTHTSSPPHPHNFEKEPVLQHGPYDYDKVIVEPTFKK